MPNRTTIESIDRCGDTNREDVNRKSLIKSLFSIEAQSILQLIQEKIDILNGISFTMYTRKTILYEGINTVLLF